MIFLQWNIYEWTRLNNNGNTSTCFNKSLETGGEIIKEFYQSDNHRKEMLQKRMHIYMNILKTMARNPVRKTSFVSLRWLIRCLVGTRAWWRHQMEAFFALLAICAGNSPVTGEFPTQRPLTRSFDAFFDMRLNEWLSKQSWGWWFETPSWSIWRRTDSRSSTPPKQRRYKNTFPLKYRCECCIYICVPKLRASLVQIEACRQFGTKPFFNQCWLIDNP